MEVVELQIFQFKELDEQAKEKFPEGWRADKPYLRWVPQPKG